MTDLITFFTFSKCCVRLKPRKRRALGLAVGFSCCLVTVSTAKSVLTRSAVLVLVVCILATLWLIFCQKCVVTNCFVLLDKNNSFIIFSAGVGSCLVRPRRYGRGCAKGVSIRSPSTPKEWTRLVADVWPDAGLCLVVQQFGKTRKKVFLPIQFERNYFSATLFRTV